MKPLNRDQIERLAARDNTLTDELGEVTASLVHHVDEVEAMLKQTLQVLSKIGNAPVFDVNPILQRGQEAKNGMSRITERTVRHINEMEELIRTSALITTSLEVNHVLDEVIDTVIQLTGADRVFLMLLKGEDDLDLTVRAARNAKGETLDPAEAAFSHSVIKAAIEDGAPLITTNAQEDERFNQQASVIRNDLRSVMVIPMAIQGVTIGVFYLDNRLASAVFHKKSIPILTAFANQAAIAIENARLFERVQTSLQRTQREVKRLRIQVDEGKLKNQVDQITDSEYFRELASIAKNLRRTDE